ncbi:MAG: ChbG/HpnK family deacetylase [Acidobacteriia bacterium]|nr:ChbG/HpnK family deacetylase [Terriglobia bacterium]
MSEKGSSAPERSRNSAVPRENTGISFGAASASARPPAGLLLVNADDWGRDAVTTDRTLDCILLGSVSSVSAMVFMADSERAARMARERNIDAGLHLNFTLPFSSPAASPRLLAHQQRIARYLKRNRLAQVLFHPGLIRSFRFVVAAQLEEFKRLYGSAPLRIDGHHHMHLCANVIWSNLLPAGTIVRKNFSFLPGQKGFLNRLYRRLVDRLLARRHRLADFFFSIHPYACAGSLGDVAALAANSFVELETHPIDQVEYDFLTAGGIFSSLGKARISSGFSLSSAESAGSVLRQAVSSGAVAGPAVARGVLPDSQSEACESQPAKHISVCICTYKRPVFLKRLLDKLAVQETGGLFTFSIVVADNDRLRSAEPLVEEFAASSSVPIRYCMQPEQNIALTRNAAIACASGDFVAFIDDDEFPVQDWLLTLFRASQKFAVDGVLGPVLPHFDQQPPRWILKGKFYERATYPTGLVIDWTKGRTGNVLLSSALFSPGSPPFRPQFQSGEDQDFFERMINAGRVFIWCNEAVAYESVPPVRWKRSFMLKRALFRGKNSAHHPSLGPLDTLKSVVAVPLYAAILPFTLLRGHHTFMIFLIKLCDHLGKLLEIAGMHPIKTPYVTE